MLNKLDLPTLTPTGKLIVMPDSLPTIQKPLQGNLSPHSLFMPFRSADLAVLNELAAYLAEQIPAMEDYLMERVSLF
jgi:hypothetical protein